ncbi:MAG: FAD-dependent oxidoreductase [bacterium]
MLGNIKAEFLSKKQLSPDTYEFTFLCKDPKEIDFLPGQYLIVIFNINGETIRRFYSISSPLRQSDNEASAKQEKNKIEFIVKIFDSGVGSKYLMNLQKNDEVQMQGPAGLFVLKDSLKNKVLIATGTGIAPIFSMIKTHMKEMKSKVMLMWGLRKNEDIYYYDMLRDMATKYENFSFEIFISREEPAENKNISILHGRVNNGVDKLIDDQNVDKSNTEFYICGDKNTMDSIRGYLIEKQILPENIKMEKFT